MAKGRRAVSFNEVSEAFAKVQALLGLQAHILPVAEDDTSCALVMGDSCTLHKNSNVLEHLRFMTHLSQAQTRLRSR